VGIEKLALAERAWEAVEDPVLQAKAEYEQRG
jgi:hypothetical protein